MLRCWSSGGHRRAPAQKGFFPVTDRRHISHSSLHPSDCARYALFWFSRIDRSLFACVSPSAEWLGMKWVESWDGWANDFVVYDTLVQTEVDGRSFSSRVSLLETLDTHSHSIKFILTYSSYPSMLIHSTSLSRTQLLDLCLAWRLIAAVAATLIGLDSSNDITPLTFQYRRLNESSASVKGQSKFHITNQYSEQKPIKAHRVIHRHEHQDDKTLIHKLEALPYLFPINPRCQKASHSIIGRTASD